LIHDHTIFFHKVVFNVKLSFDRDDGALIEYRAKLPVTNWL